MKQILCVNAAGQGDLHELRARRLTERLEAEVTYFNINRSSRRESGQALWALLQSTHWDLVYQESTGIAAGLNLIRAAVTRRQKFIVSSGDPIRGFFEVTKGPAAGRAFGAYERMLLKTCAGFVGWTPYLTGRAMELGARRAVTVEGAVDLEVFHPYNSPTRRAAKAKYGLNLDHLVCGVVGSLNWTPRQSYCYGLELIESLKKVTRPDISVLIVGDGSGAQRLRALVPDELRARVVFTGRLPEAEVVGAMNAMDIGFITQTLDALGNYRLTTKLPEYLACGLPVAMSPTPGFYDYALPAGWALPARHPASPEFHARCAQWLDRLPWNEVAARAANARDVACKHFDYVVVGERFRQFVNELLAA